VGTLAPLSLLFTHLPDPEIHPQGEASFLPLLAWQLVLIQTSKQTKIMEPVLAFAKESTVYLVQGEFQDQGDNVGK
jgi:hypothetical protein